MKNKNVKYVFLIKMSGQTSLNGGVIALIFILVLCGLLFCICIISGRIENLFNHDNMQNDEEIINNEVRQSDKKIPLYKLDDSIVEI